MTPEEINEAQAIVIEHQARLLRGYRFLANDVIDTLQRIPMGGLSNRMMALDLAAHSALEQLNRFEDTPAT